MIALLLAFLAGVGAGAWAHARAVAHRAEEAAWDETRARAFADAGDRLYEQLDAAGRLLRQKDELLVWFVAAYQDKTAKLRRAPSFRTPHAGDRL